jgi:hypothetical protein
VELLVETASKFITPTIVFLLTLASGVWLSNSGKPLNTVILTLHKLIALGAVIVTALQIYETLKTTEIQAAVIALLIVAGLCVVALFVTGALMSMGRRAYDLLLTTHRVAPLLAVMAMAATIYLLNTGTSHLSH